MHRTLMALCFATLAAVAAQRAGAEEPKPTDTVDMSSSMTDRDKQTAIPGGTGVVLSQKEWERLAAAWDVKNPPKVDFSKELLLVGTWRGTSFKFLNDVKNGDLTTELVGDKEDRPGFRYRVVSLPRAGITSFMGKALPKD